MRQKIVVKGIAIGALLLWSNQAFSALVSGGPSIVPGTLNIFRDFRAANDVGVGSGDLFQYGADIVGGSAGVSIAGIFTPAPGNPTPGFTTAFGKCAPLAVDPNFCFRTSSFSTPARTDGTWQVEFKNAGGTVIAPLPAVDVIPPAPVPFPHSVAITPGGGTGTTPTISWVLPAGVTPNTFRVQIFNKSKILENGQADVIHSINLRPTATSYTFPTVLSAGGSLKPGGNYAIAFQVIDTRDGLFSSNNSDFLTRSLSFFDFSLPKAGSPPVIALPTILPSGVYSFSVGSVGPTSTTFIDPAVAIGYDYATGAGDPNFASVTLPDIGDGIYSLSYLGTSTTLDAGTQYFFPAGGVSGFSVTGIDASAGLDPTNGLSFVTGLTFVSPGSFTGTMTPLTLDVSVPEPASAGLLLAGVAIIPCLRRRRRT